MAIRWWFVPLGKDHESQKLIPVYVAMLEKMKVRRKEREEGNE